MMYSRCKLPQAGWAHFMSPMRAWGEKPFSARDRLIVNLLHRELGRLWSQVDRGPLATLSPRLRQTADLIFSGYSEKEMAQALNVSTHTVHDFCRRLYRHFHVSGRGGLLTNPACRQLIFRPALSPAYYAHDRGQDAGTFPK
jgi:DNA-binding CsgD family transcriptional regulator